MLPAGQVETCLCVSGPLMRADIKPGGPRDSQQRLSTAAAKEWKILESDAGIWPPHKGQGGLLWIVFLWETGRTGRRQTVIPSPLELTLCDLERDTLPISR